MQSLVQNTVTHDAPDIHVPGVFSLTERTYGFASYRSAHYVCSINRKLLFLFIRRFLQNFCHLFNELFCIVHFVRLIVNADFSC